YPTPNSMVEAKYLKNPSSPYLTIENFLSADKKYLLFQYLVSEHYLEDIKQHHCVTSLLIADADLQAMVKTGSSEWKKYVPEVVAKYISDNKLYK
ncbi:MAG: hypothetical protein IT287_01175, partial [Bdellovibrionaceae bacterium]|nr:hypothetical protein [Pseudobdellovibrionaceae bacterium]